MSALVGAGRLDTACEVLDWMAEDGVAGNAVVYQTLINAFLERGQQPQVGVLGTAACVCCWLGSHNHLTAALRCQYTHHAQTCAMHHTPPLCADRLAAGAHGAGRRAVQPSGGGAPHLFLLWPQPATRRVSAVQGKTGGGVGWGRVLCVGGGGACRTRMACISVAGHGAHGA